MTKGILEFIKHRYTFTICKKGNEKIYKITEQFGHGPKTTKKVSEWEFNNFINFLYVFGLDKFVEMKFENISSENTNEEN